MSAKKEHGKLPETFAKRNDEPAKMRQIRNGCSDGIKQLLNYSTIYKKKQIKHIWGEPTRNFSYNFVVTLIQSLIYLLNTYYIYYI